MEPLTKLQTFLESIMIEGEYNNFEQITGDVLKHIVTKLPEFDEFKDVKKINILSQPSYLVKEGTNIPVGDNYVGNDTKVILTQTRKLADGVCDLSEEIDLYAISLSPIIYDPNDLDEANNNIGVFRTPMLYDHKSFKARQKIIVTWSKEDMQDAMGDSDETVDERLVKMFKEALDGKHDLPKRRGIMVRISPRSNKQVEKVTE